jgi:hypothetical protein
MDVQALGQYLREAREAKELSLDDAEHALRIRRRILESFESGDFNLPDFSPVQIRGFIRNYGRYLGLEEDRVIQLYETALVETNRRGMTRGKKAQQRPRENGNGKRITSEATAARNGSTSRSTGEYTPPTMSAEPQRGRLGALFGILLRIVIAVASLAVIALVMLQFLQSPPLEVQPTATVPGLLGDLPPTGTFTPEPTNIVVLLPTNASLPSIDGVLVNLQLNQRTWMRLSVDGVDQFIGMARPGSTLEYRANDRIELTASNAQALAVTLNGQRQPSLGMRGQQVTAVFERTGMQILSGANFEPTSTTSPTPEPTPTDSAGALVEQLTPDATVDPLLLPPATVDPLLAPPTTDPLLAGPTTDPALLAPTATLPAVGGASDAVLPITTLAAADLLSISIPSVTPEGNAAPPAAQNSGQTITGGQAIPTALPLPGMPTQPPAEVVQPTQPEVVAASPTPLSIVPATQPPAEQPAPTVPPATLAPTATLPPTEPPTATPTFTPSYTLPPSMTPTTPPSRTPTPTFTPTITLTPTQTAILPPRATPVNATPTKTGA